VSEDLADFHNFSKMASPLPPDPYQALGVAKDATIATIKSAHRKLVLQCHPDKVKDESLRAQKQDEFQKVHQAYEILSDEQKRREYDERVRLAELRREVMERGGGRGAAHYQVSNGSMASPFFEVRNNRVYEERVPRRSYEEDHVSSQYEQQRASARKYDGYEPSSRRPSVREQDERRRDKALDDERQKDWTRETERSSHSDRRRTREKDRKRDYDDKYSHRSYVEDGSDSGSDETEVYVSRRQGSGSRKGHEDLRRNERAMPATPGRSGSRREAEEMDDWQHNLMKAHEYMQKSRNIAPVEVEPRRPSAYRSATQSGNYVEPRVPHSAFPSPIDAPRRSSARDRDRDRDRDHDRERDRDRAPEHSRPRSSGRDRKGSIEIIEPMSRGYDPRKVPGMPTSASSPASIKVPTSLKSSTHPQRSTTMQYVRDSKHDRPSIRRRETAPMASTTSRRNDNGRAKSSELRIPETHDSGYSSPGTPEMQYSGGSFQPRSSTKYQIVDEEDDHTQGHRTVLVDPDSNHRRPRSISPKRRRTPERPTLSRRGTASARPVPASRSMSYAPSPEAAPSSRQVPTLSRTESARPPAHARMASSREGPPTTRGMPGRSGSQLYGEVVAEEPYSVQYSPTITADSIRWSSHSRKGSDSTGGDAYPRSKYPESHRHPGMGRQESYVH